MTFVILIVSSVKAAAIFAIDAAITALLLILALYWVSVGTLKVDSIWEIEGNRCCSCYLTLGYG